MGRGRVSNPPRLCTECGKEFVPLNSLRFICYEPECEENRSQRYNLDKMEKRRQMKEDGEWKEHVERVRGTGRGRRGKPHGNMRKCLGWCGEMFPVAPGTDDHFCRKCDRRRLDTAEQFEETALGICVSELGETYRKGDRAWHRPRRLN